MGSSRKRTRLATGIYSDKYGIGVFVKGKEHRFPPRSNLDRLRRWRRDQIDAASVRQSTFDRDAVDHLATVPDGRARDDQRAILHHWRDVFGSRASTGIEPKEIKAQLVAWLHRGPNGEPLSRKHLNNMLHVLRAVYRTNYQDTCNPAADVPVFTVKYLDARAIPDEVKDLILNGMADTAWTINENRQTPRARDPKPPPPNLAKLRLIAMRETGFAQAMLQRIRPHHLDEAAKTVYTEMRLKGRGVVGATTPITDRGLAALCALRDAGGLTAFNTRSLGQAWTRAIARARRAWARQEAASGRKRPWPLSETARAYDLRHSFGTEVLVVTGDLEATATLMRHANINTTRRYTQAAANIRAALAVQSLNKAASKDRP